MTQFYYVDIILHLSLLILFNWNAVLSQRSSSCYTPDNELGICINIRKCPPLIQVLKNKNPANIRYLLESKCGFEGRNPLVCCPRGNRPPGTPSPEFQPTLNLDSKGTVDVSRHPGVEQFLPESCGYFTDEKITGGNATGLFEFPWMALLGYITSKGIQYNCGGTLINARYVVTAAHCIKTSPSLKLFRVRLGEYNLNTEVDCQVEAGCAPPLQEFGIEEAITHPNYIRADVRNDVGLIRLDQNAVFTDAVIPICLPVGKAQQEKSLEGDNVYVTGWGITERGVSSSVLMKVRVPVIPLEVCAENYSKYVRITEKQICAGGTDQRDSCAGDSGGPLQKIDLNVFGDYRYVQYGIVSFGPQPCGEGEKPGVYTRIGYYMKWILDNMHY